MCSSAERVASDAGGCAGRKRQRAGEGLAAVGEGRVHKPGELRRRRRPGTAHHEEGRFDVRLRVEDRARHATQEAHLA